jgi:hypothetical protein
MVTGQHGQRPKKSYFSSAFEYVKCPFFWKKLFQACVIPLSFLEFVSKIAINLIHGRRWGNSRSHSRPRPGLILRTLHVGRPYVCWQFPPCLSLFVPRSRILFVRPRPAMIYFIRWCAQASKIPFPWAWSPPAINSPNKIKNIQLGG